MRAADLLTILTNPPRSKEYQGIFLMTKNHKRPVTTIEITQKNEVILHFNQQKKRADNERNLSRTNDES